MNGIFLKLLLGEIRGSLVNHVVNRVTFKDRLVQLELDNGSFFISLYPQAPCVYISARIAGLRKLDFYDEHLSGFKINDASQPDLMPTLQLIGEKLSYGQHREIRLNISLYREAPNLVAWTGDIKKTLFSRFIEKTPRRSFLELSDSDLIDKTRLLKDFDGIDKSLAEELNRENLEKLKKIFNGMAARPRLISIAPLRVSYFSEKSVREYPSLNDLLKDALPQFLEQNRVAALESAKKNQIKKIEDKLERLKRDLPDSTTIEDYRIRGEMLLANIAKVKKGMTSARLFNPYVQKEIEIVLDPTKSPQENAQQYFRRFKKAKRGAPRIVLEIASLKKEIEKIERQLIVESTQTATATKAKRLEKPLPFRTFGLVSGSTVQVGKNSRSNELLTFRFARPDDYFFHARGIEGAHIILKPKMPKNQKPKREDVEAAASIAAFYSKAKKQKKVPVSYTQRKYLKKNKKGKPGSVILMREEVIFVDPIDPTTLLQH